MFSTRYYFIETSEDVVGVEACAALKNFYALGVGAAAGRLDRDGVAKNGAGMHNPAAALFSQAVREMEHLVTAVGGLLESVHSPAGVGDLYVTCQAGRNSRMGRLLGSGMRYREAKSHRMPDDTVEGADLARAVGPAIEEMMARGDLDSERLPLTAAILDAVLRNRDLVLPGEAS
jgi:glycerol-3-phosphate dehydrogenase (NAD(P)+)